METPEPYRSCMRDGHNTLGHMQSRFNAAPCTPLGSPTRRTSVVLLLASIRLPELRLHPDYVGPHLPNIFRLVVGPVRQLFSAHRGLVKTHLTSRLLDGVLLCCAAASATAQTKQEIFWPMESAETRLVGKGTLKVGASMSRRLWLFCLSTWRICPGHPALADEV